MKNFKLHFGLVFVLLLGSISCTNDDFQNIPAQDFEDIQLREVDPVNIPDSIPDVGVDPKNPGKDN